MTDAAEKKAAPLWQRNLLFSTVCLVGIGVGGFSLLRTETMALPEYHEPGLAEQPDFRSVVEKVNAQFAADWKEADLKPAPRAADLTLARRLSLGLTGTIPSLEEIRALEAQPESDRIQWWLSHLFEDRRTSDYLAERFARFYVGIENGPFLVYRRRRFVSWLGDQFHENRPYDDLVRTLITAQGLWTNNPEVNFLTVTIDQNDDAKGPDEVKLAARLTRAFLGVRIDCVQCHNDRLGDRWKQKDFHQLASFFAGADMSFSGLLEDEKEYEFTYRRKTESEVVPPVVPFQPELLPAEGERRERLAQWVTHSENRAFARSAVNRVWALLFGRPLVDPIDEIPLEGPYPPGLQLLADDLVAHGYDLRRLIRLIAATDVFGADSRVAEGRPPLTQKHEEHLAGFPISRLRPEQVAGSVLQASSLSTLDVDTHIFLRIARALQEGEFIQRYGDFGEDEFNAQSGTIPQRLLMMNGEMVHSKIGENSLFNAAGQISMTAPGDEETVEAAYLTILSRRPTPAETDHFAAELKGQEGDDRREVVENLFWALFNSTEFSWNH